MDAAAPPARPTVLAVAASGGRDSTALLHAVCRQAAAHGIEVLALHVHHGLNPQADGWAAQLRAQCTRWRRKGWPLRLQVFRLQTGPASGESVEAWARRERYAALAGMARAAGVDTVLLAHHRRDQAETVLLQALRGAGAAGLAAMPAASRRDGISWLRPWLNQPAQAIASYIRRWQLSHVDDDSNADTRYDRNRLRHQVWPALVGSFAQAEASLCQVARQAQHAAALIDEVAAADLLALGLGPDRAVVTGTGLVPAAVRAGLPLAPWLRLSAVRRRYALRAWLQGILPAGPSEALLERLLAELPASHNGRWPDGQGGELRLYRGLLQRADPGPELVGVAADLPRLELAMPTPGIYPAPGWAGAFEVRSVPSGGVDPRWLQAVILVPRRGGEQFQSQPHGMPRSLKKQFQSAAVPAWARSGPLLMAAPALGGHLIFVPGLGLDARLWAPAGTPQFDLCWHADGSRLER